LALQIRKLLKHRLFKVALATLAIFVIASAIMYLVPWTVIQIIAVSVHVSNALAGIPLFVISIIFNTLLLPLYFLESQKAIDSWSHKRHHRRRFAKAQ
jgi:hypothetical protein